MFQYLYLLLTATISDDPPLFPPCYRLDSFVLAETFKYLYLLFADESDLVLDINEFVFSTEAHLFPLTLARLSNLTAVPVRSGGQRAGLSCVQWVGFQGI